MRDCLQAVQEVSVMPIESQWQASIATEARANLAV